MTRVAVRPRSSGGTLRLLLISSVLTMLLSISATSVVGQVDPPDLRGTWSGALALPTGASLRIVFHITPAPGGGYSATMDSPDQGAVGLPMDGVTLDGDTVRIGFAAIQGGYAGALSDDGSRLSGLWSQGPASLPLDLERTGTEGPPLRPQDPVPPLPYGEELVTFASADAGVTLAGTLTLPAGGGAHAAVVLISGSGPQNRDEELMNHRPFRVLADHLTRAGVAVLRFDDRGVGESTGSFAAATSVDFAQDVRGAVAYLGTRPEVDRDRIGLVGHSEGGLIAPMVATGSSDVAFIVLLAGPGMTGAEILELQGELIARAGGASEAAIAFNTGIQRELIQVLKSGEDPAVALPPLMERISARLAALSEEDMAALGIEDPAAPMASLQQAAGAMFTPWFRYFVSYDPRPTLEGVEVPVLAINGELDLQVPPAENLSEIGAALERGGNGDHTEIELPGLNHLFQTAATGAPSEYAEIDETVSPTALNVVRDWILERFGT